MEKAFLITFYGKVQGVGFRSFVLGLAKRMNLSGFVKNTSAGNLEIFVQGPEEKLETFIFHCNNGPLLSKVINTSIKQLKTDNAIKDFKIIK